MTYSCARPTRAALPNRFPASVPPAVPCFSGRGATPIWNERNSKVELDWRRVSPRHRAAVRITRSEGSAVEASKILPSLWGRFQHKPGLRSDSGSGLFAQRVWSELPLEWGFCGGFGCAWATDNAEKGKIGHRCLNKDRSKEGEKKKTNDSIYISTSTHITTKHCAQTR